MPSDMACLTLYLFTDCMSILEASQQTVAIPLEYIYSQCFDISTSNFLRLTLVNENERAL